VSANLRIYSADPVNSIILFAFAVKKTKLAFVDSVAKPPRNVLRQQKKHGTAGLIRGLDPLASLSSHRGNSRKRPF